MSKRRGAKGRCLADILEEEELNREIREYAVSLVPYEEPCYSDSSEVYPI